MANTNFPRPAMRPNTSPSAQNSALSTSVPKLLSFLCFLLPLLAAAWLLWPALAGGQMLWGYDQENLSLPYQSAARRSWSLGLWPLWTPEVRLGMPGLQACGIDFLYPPLFAMHLLEVPLAALFGYLGLLQLCLAAWGTFLFARALGQGRGASLMAGLFYAFSGSLLSMFFCGHTNNLIGLSLIPWAFLGVHQASQALLKKTSSLAALPGLVLCGAALGLQILGLGIQICAYTAPVVMAYGLWQLLKSDSPQSDASGIQAAGRSAEANLGASATIRNPKYFMFLLIPALAFLLAAPQILPTMQYLPYSWHGDLSYKYFTDWSFPPGDAICYLVPGYHGWSDPLYIGQMASCTNTEYLGLLPLALALAALLLPSSSAKPSIRFFMLLAVASFIIALGKWTPLHLLFYHLPVYKSFRGWNRFLCFFSFSISLLAGFGWQGLLNLVQAPETWSKTKNIFSPSALAAFRAPRSAFVFALSTAFISLLCYGLASQTASAGAPKIAAHFRDSSQLIPALTNLLHSSCLRALARALVLASLLAALFYRPRGPRFWQLAPLALLPFHAWDLSEMVQRFVVFKDPQQVLAVADYSKALPSLNGPEPFRVDDPGQVENNRLMYLGIESVGGFHGMVMQSSFDLSKALPARTYLNLVGAKYILQANGNGEAQLLSNPQAFRRAFFVHKSRVIPAGKDLWARLAQADFDPAKEVILENGQALDTPASASEAITWLARNPQQFNLQAASSSPAYLVVSQTWYPGWQAWVDGQPSPVLKADGALQAIYFPAGNHKVEFKFQCPLFFTGLGLSALGLALASLLLFFGLKNRSGVYGGLNQASLG